MAIQPPENLFHLFGLVAWGDIAELTMYKSKRGKVVVFQKSYPEHLPHEGQLHQQAKFTAASQAWRSAPLDVRAGWEAVTKRLSLPMTGYNLWMAWHLDPDPPAFATLRQQTGINLVGAWPRLDCTISLCASYWDHSHRIIRSTSGVQSAYYKLFGPPPYDYMYFGGFYREDPWIKWTVAVPRPYTHLTLGFRMLPLEGLWETGYSADPFPIFQHGRTKHKFAYDLGGIHRESVWGTLTY